MTISSFYKINLVYNDVGEKIERESKMHLDVLAVVAKMPTPQNINYIIGFLVLIIVIIIGSVLFQKHN